MVNLRRLGRDFGGLAVVLGLLLLVNVLPPDTSLAEVEKTGALRACVPSTYPPLVTGDPDRPGIDIEILRAVADDMGVALLLSPNDAIGRDFNPRNWAVNRAKCQVIAGGVVDSQLTRSFLDTGPAYARTGWALVSPEPLDDLRGRSLGVLTVISGLDRIGLASALRAQDVTVRVVRNESDLASGIASGAFDGGATESLLAGQIAAENGWVVRPVADLARYNLVLGLWKGDLTLKRRVVRAFRSLEKDGTLAAILARYGAAPLKG